MDRKQQGIWGCIWLFSTLLSLASYAQSSSSVLAELDSLTYAFQELYKKENPTIVLSQIKTIAHQKRFAPYGDILQRYWQAEHALAESISLADGQHPIDYFQENVQFLENKGSRKKAALTQALLALNLHRLTITKYREGDMSGKEALPELLRVQQICENNNAPCLQSARMLYELGEFYYFAREHELAIHYLEEAGAYMESVSWDWLRINHANTLGLCYLHRKKYEKAIEAYADIPTYVSLPEDSIWIGIAHGNIAEANYRIGNYSAALKYLPVDIAYSKKYQDSCSVAEAYILQMKLWIKENKPQQAAKSLDSLRWWVKKCESRATTKNGLLAESLYYEWRGDYTMAYQQFKRSRVMLDSIRREQAKQKIQANTMRFKAEQYQAELEIERQQRAYFKLQRNVVLGGGVLLLLLGFLLYKYRKAQLERKRMQSELERQKLQQSLEESRLKLQGFSDALKRKNQIIEDISQELEASKENINKEAIIQQLCEATILTTEDWLRFSHLFEQVHPNFVTSIKEKYPQLTQNDIRILVLSQLAFSTRDMASTLGVSLDAIHKAKYRLRKKLSLSSDIDLSDIAQLS